MSLARALVPVIAFSAAAHAVASWDSFISYDNEFVDPDIILSKPWTKDHRTADAAQSIVAWADALYNQGPWSVTYKNIAAPTGDKHDYMSWAPYWWPDCSNVGNKTELTPQQIWVTCPYKDRDGQFVPDVRLINDTGAFAGMSDAVFYNTLAWQITGKEAYAKKAVTDMRTWFIDEDTFMNPNLNFSQVHRGPGVQKGDHCGVLDMKTISKVGSAILLMRKAKFAGWTADDDTKFNSWAKQFIGWLETHPFGHDEGTAPNNHGTYFYNTMVTCQILTGNMTGARHYLDRYFTTQYLNQIDANGEQPYEVVRSRRYHYRAYGLGATIINAKLAQYIGYNVWNLTTSKGGTIQKAADWAMTFDPASTNETTSAPAEELYQHVAAVASVYGDPDGKYASFLASKNPDYPQSPFFLWNQPLALPANYTVSRTVNVTGEPGGTIEPKEGQALGRESAGVHGALMPTLTIVLAVVIFQLARFAVAHRV
ncbi:chondroitin AC/alginate lyase [Auricularia subglabra TFB-10046 SS5]|uniref:Chondroitin AC/alginate lyase n=1 Tax=Auricularia subglabra (strain TFB-10046 / SS5) TaxID=717982 RepID=J0D1D8_AURST|nr:chondroitin AC/alginate lyase [Auricularia subglabra TFB-10046 SS5]